MSASSSKHRKGSREPKEPKKSKPLVVTGDRCSHCGNLKTEPPVEGKVSIHPCERCNGRAGYQCTDCVGVGSYSVRIGGCKSQAEHYSTNPHNY